MTAYSSGRATGDTVSAASELIEVVVGATLAMLLSGARNHSVICLKDGLLTQTKGQQNRQAMGCILDLNYVIGMKIFPVITIQRNVLYMSTIQNNEIQ